MKHEVDINHKVVAEINGYTIVRSEAKRFSTYEGKLTGHTKVYYDVCDSDMDLLESFKTLKEAKSFCK